MISRPDGQGAFLVQTDESYRPIPPDLVRLRTIAKPADDAPRWDELTFLTERATVTLPGRVEKDLQRRLLKAEERGALVDLLNHQVLLLHTLPLTDLPAQAQYFVETLNDVRFTEDSSRGPFGNTWVHLVETNPALLHRLKLASVFMRIEQDHRLGGGDPRHIDQLESRGGRIFSSSAGLYDGVIMFDAYLSPLLAAGTPGIWGVNVVRSFGSLIFSLGAFVSGTDGEASELLQLVTTPGATKTTQFPRLSAMAADGAIQWWTERLNLLFGVLSDLSTFTDADGNYRPAKHLEAMLTVEQIFRRSTSMLVAHRDTNARRTLLFTILDSLEGVRGTDLLTMFTLSHATKVLAEVEALMPAPAAEILLPAARRGVSALQEMQQGFFIRHQLRTATVDLHLGGGTTQPLSVEAATARYLKVLRDATHGHGSNRESSRALTAALLSHHDGEIPHDLGLLGYLYLLDVLAHPERLRRLLFRGGR
ncbi:hypothetical protein FBY26_3985 [Phycicoccus sp. SLBN-51]|nr:hypothetical protein FBY26_3985 [Phycicoccus sp. SLBN-51]